MNFKFSTNSHPFKKITSTAVLKDEKLSEKCKIYVQLKVLFSTPIRANVFINSISVSDETFSFVICAMNFC